MTQKNRNNNEKSKSKRKQSKFFMRRIAIVVAGLLILWLVVLLIGKVFTSDPLTDPLETQASGDPTESVETTNSDETTQNGTDASTQTMETSQSEVEPQTKETEQSTTASTSETTEPSSNSETTTKEGIIMDFTSVSYYIQALDARYQAYYNSNKALAASEIVKNVNMNLDFDFYGHIQKVDDPNALSVICNKYYQLPSDFTPANLTSVPDGYYVADGKTYQLKQNALDAFVEMSDAANKEGLSLKIISAYRTNSYQANLYQKYKNNNGQTAADRFSARPGHSEHETGLAIDINDVAQAFENTAEFTWLSEHAHEFGYVLRYPSGMENVTGYMYEPWHYRYLGVDIATQLKNSGLTYDAYYAMYLIE